MFPVPFIVFGTLALFSLIPEKHNGEIAADNVIKPEENEPPKPKGKKKVKEEAENEDDI